MGPFATSLARRLARRYGELAALAEMTAATLGMDPKSTRRTLTALEKAADAKLAALRALRNGHEPRRPPTPAELLAAARGHGDA